MRSFALARTHANGASGKPGLHPDRVPLLKACDTLRDDLAAHGVLIKVRWRRLLPPSGLKVKSKVKGLTFVSLGFPGSRGRLDMGDQ